MSPDLTRSCGFAHRIRVSYLTRLCCCCTHPPTIRTCLNACVVASFGNICFCHFLIVYYPVSLPISCQSMLLSILPFYMWHLLWLVWWPPIGDSVEWIDLSFLLDRTAWLTCTDSFLGRWCVPIISPACSWGFTRHICLVLLAWWPSTALSRLGAVDNVKK